MDTGSRKPRHRRSKAWDTIRWAWPNRIDTNKRFDRKLDPSLSVARFHSMRYRWQSNLGRVRRCRSGKPPPVPPPHCCYRGWASWRLSRAAETSRSWLVRRPIAGTKGNRKKEKLDKTGFVTVKSIDQKIRKKNAKKEDIKEKDGR